MVFNFSDGTYLLHYNIIRSVGNFSWKVRYTYCESFSLISWFTFLPNFNLIVETFGSIIYSRCFRMYRTEIIIINRITCFKRGFTATFTSFSMTGLNITTVVLPSIRWTSNQRTITSRSLGWVIKCTYLMVVTLTTKTHFVFIL